MALQTLFMPGIAQGRLTLASGTPVPVTDQTAKTTVYFTPYKGNLISLYDGANWAIVPFTEASVAVPSTVFKCFDVFGYLNSGALAIETLDWTQTTAAITGATNATPIVITSAGHGLSVGNVVGINGVGGNTGANSQTWTISAVATDTFTLASSIGNGAYTSGGTWYKINNSRATALVTTTGGVYTKSGDATRLYLGTGCTTDQSGQTESSFGGTNQVGGKRLLVNYYNRVSQEAAVIDTTDNWNYQVQTWRQSNGVPRNKVEILVGVSEDIVKGMAQSSASNANAVTVAGGIGLDTITENSSLVRGGILRVGQENTLVAHYTGYPSAGYHNLNWLEISTASGATLWKGDSSGISLQTGMIISMMG